MFTAISTVDGLREWGRVGEPRDEEEQRRRGEERNSMTRAKMTRDGWVERATLTTT